jgi:D-alanyl-D-alanine carboxypeptidase
LPSLPAPSLSLEGLGRRALERTLGPSLAIAAIRDGELAYAQAFGEDRVHLRSASVGSVYNIASVSKQFTATCVLLLMADGRLRLDDPVATYFPDLASASKVTLRHLLTHTSGYWDYYPLGYPDAEKLSDAEPDAIVHKYAKRPLQFEPGSAWSYSNTGYHILGRVVEMVSGMPFGEFLTARVLRPAGMTESFFNDPPRITGAHAAGYSRYALGPVRSVKGERAGWTYASGGIASSLADLSTWCMGLFEHRILDAALTQEMMTPYRLNDGALSPTAMGWFVEEHGTTTLLQHSGAVAGFVSQVMMVPATRCAAIVLANGDHVQTGAIARAALEEITATSLGLPKVPRDRYYEAEARIWTDALRGVNVDRARLTEPMREFFTDDRAADVRAGLGPLGSVLEARTMASGERGGMPWYRVRVAFEHGSADEVIRETPEGRLAEFGAYPIP